MNLQQIRATRWQQVAVVAMVIAGILHLSIAPTHWDHEPAHGIFFVLSGLIQIAWAVIFIRRPTLKLSIAGMVIAIGLIVLWGLSVSFPAPFGYGPEEIDTAGLVCKLAEAIAALALAGLIFQVNLAHVDRLTAWRSLIGVITISCALGMLSYSLARASEPLLPGLAALGDDHDHTSSWTEAELVSAATLAERSGIDVTQIAITAMGAALDVRFKVLEPAKATAMMEEHELMPFLVVEDSDTVLTGPEGMAHTFSPRQGLIYYMFYPNPDNILKSGDAVSIVIGDSRLEHFIVQ